MIMSRMDVNALKEIPGYKPIVKIVLQTQIQLLLEQLSDHTGGESIVMTAGVNDGSLTYYGSTGGRGFLEDQEDLKSKYLAYCMKSHLSPKTMQVGKRTNESSHFESCNNAKRRRKHGLPHLEETITDKQPYRSFTAEPVNDNESLLMQSDTGAGFMPEVSLPNPLDLNDTQTLHRDNEQMKGATPTVDALGSEITFGERGHSVGGPRNGAHDARRMGHPTLVVKGGRNDGDSKNKDRLSTVEDRNAAVDDERLAQLLAEDEQMSADSSDNYFEDNDDKDEDPVERKSIGSSCHGNFEIKIENVEGDHGIVKTDIESDDDVIIIDIDSDKNTSSKDSGDKGYRENVTGKESGDNKVKDEIGKYLAEQRKVMNFAISPNYKGSDHKLVSPKQRNASKPLIKKSNTVDRGYLQDMSRQEALKTSVSLLNKPLDVALLGKRRDSKSKSPIRGSVSPNTNLKDGKKTDNNLDEGMSALSNVKVKTEAPWSVKPGEVDLRFSDSGRIRFDSGYCIYSEDEKREITRYACKCSADDASKRYSVPINTVKYWMKYGNKHKHDKYSEERRSEVLAFASKYGLVAASSNFNVPYNTVRFWRRSSDTKGSFQEMGRFKTCTSKYTEEEREKITQYAFENGTVAASKHYRVPFGTISVWKSWKKQKISRAKGPAVLKKSGLVCRKEGNWMRCGIDTERKIVDWVKEKYEKKEHVSGKMVLSLVKEKLPMFKATYGWLNGFLTRNGLKNHVSHGSKDSKQAVEGISKVPGEVSQNKGPSEDNQASVGEDRKGRRKRRNFTEVQKANILRYATVRSVKAACLFYKVAPSQLYTWRATRALIKESKVLGKINTGPTCTSGMASNEETMSENSHIGARPDNADNICIVTESSESDLKEREEEVYTEPDITQDGDTNSNNINSHDNVETTRVDDPKIQPSPNPKLHKKINNPKGRNVSYGEKIDFEIFWWIIQQGKQGKEVSGNMIRAHALSLVKQKRPDLDFKASDSWMKAFLRRHNLELHFEKDDQ